MATSNSIKTEVDPAGDEIFSQCDTDLNQRSVAGVLTYALGWLLIVLTTDVLQIHSIFSYTIGALLISIGMLRIFIYWKFEYLYESSSSRWRWFFTLGMLSSASLWALFTSLSLYHVGMSDQAIIILTPVIMIAAGGVFSLAPRMPLILSFISIMVLPQVVALILQHVDSAYAVAFMLFLFYLFILVYGKNAHKNYIQLLQKNKLLELRTQQLEYAKELAETANHAKSQFLANVSHELRTPMNGILGATDLLYSEDMDADEKELITIIKQSGKSLLSLLNDLLDFSKIEAGKMELDNIAFNLDHVLDHLHHLLEIKAKEKELDFSITKKPDVPSYLVGDEIRIQQILLNLVGNAIKFTESGQVSLSIQKVRENFLYFEIKDSGIGISAEKQALLFRSFQQMESSTTRKYGGTGLGLAISKTLVELMHGKIGVKSRKQKGSCFWFEIPFVESEPLVDDDVTQEIRAIGSLNRKHCKILLAEDIQVNQKIAIGLLKKLGVTDVTTVNNGNEAIQQLQQYDFDMVLMDIQMPECGGIEACKKIRSTTHNDEQAETSVRDADIPIIALTANVMKSDVEDYLAAGMNDHLAKPIEKNQLKMILTKWLVSCEAEN